MEKYQEFLEREFFMMKYRLDRIDQEQDDIIIKERWIKESNEHYAKQERLNQKLTT